MLGKILFITSMSGGLPGGMKSALLRMKTNYKEAVIWEMEEAVKEFQPSLMIFFHHFLKDWNEDIIKRIQALPQCHKFYWDWECPWEIDYIKQYHGLFSRILVQDKSSMKALNPYIENKAVFVPHAADPESCPHMEYVPFEYRSDLLFIGAAYPSRLKFLREVLPYLRDYKCIIGGHGYEMLPAMENQLLLNNGISGKEYLLYTNGAKVVLNLHRGSDELTMANNEHIKASSPNNRLFEVNMMGKFQMVDTLRSEINDYYPDAVTFSSPKDFINKFYIYYQDDTERHIMEEEARGRTLKFHTYEHRFSEIIAPLI